MILPSHEYSRNQLDILIKREARTEPCKGCRHDNSQMVFGKKVNGCAIGRRRPNGKCYIDQVGPTCVGESE